MNPEMIHRTVSELWNARKIDEIAALAGPDYTYTGADGNERPGIQAGLDVARMFAAAFPDATLTVDNVYVAGNVVIAEMTGRGTHGGDLMGIAPTHRAVTIKICNVMELRDGKIHREREYFDMASMLAQLGVSSIPAHAASA
jgi:steroid delta-isomerase-like uncharacterized protein